MEDFITFKIAKKLKDLGFNEPFFFFYREDDKDKYIHHAMICKPLIYCSDVDDEVIIAPTISQVLKWLREEKKMHITVSVITDCSNDADNNICEEWSFWSFSVINLNDGSTLYDDFETIDCIEYQSYEEAALAGIEYVLDNLI